MPNLADVERKSALRAGIRLYDLASDPGETRDLYREGDPEAAELLALLDQLAAMPRAEGDEIGVDAETRERLRSLGYLD